MNILFFREPGLLTAGLQTALEPLLQRIPRLTLRHAALEEIRRDGIRGDVFCSAHGEIYPVELEEPLLAFLAAGGRLLHVGGAPFGQPMRKNPDTGAWEPVKRTLREALPRCPAGLQDFEFNVFRARLGIHAYVPSFPEAETADLRLEFDPDLIRAGAIAWHGPLCGMEIATTVPIGAVAPESGGDNLRAYMGKPVVRCGVPAGTVRSPDGASLGTALLLVKAWGNPFRKARDVAQGPWALYSGILDAAFPAEVLERMLAWLALPACLVDIEVPLPSLRAGEITRAAPKLHGVLPARWRVVAESASMTAGALLDGTPPAWQPAHPADPCGPAIEVGVAADALMTALRFLLLDETGCRRDRIESGVTGWRPERLRQVSTRIHAEGSRLRVEQAAGAAPTHWVQGTNWQDSPQYGFTYHNPNPWRLAQDARSMAEAGMVMVRSHFMPPGWFRTTPGSVFGDLWADLYDGFPTGPELDERHLRAFETHAMIFGSFGLIFMPTLFTNPDHTMGNPQHWMGSARAVTVRGMIENQKEMGRRLAARFGNLPCLCWDLYNEPDTNMTQCGRWLLEHKPIWTGGGQLAGIGTFSMRQNLLLGEAPDWHSIHTPCCKTSEQKFHTGKPVLTQEAWCPTPADRQGEEDLEHALNRGLTWTLRLGGTGFMPWNWNKLAHYWRYGVGFVEFWDHDLGVACQGDGTRRRGWVTLRNWSLLLRGLLVDQAPDRQILVLYPKLPVESCGCEEYFDAIHNAGYGLAGINDADFASADLSAARLVVLPYHGAGWRESTWQRLRAFAAAGGVVWAHTDALLFNEDGLMAPGRNIPARDAVESVGQGRFEWACGFHTGCGRTLDRFKTVLAGAGIRPGPERELPLADGGRLRFHERRAADETTMRTDWVPLQRLSERNIVNGITIQDASGRLRGGWSCEGLPFMAGDRMVHGSGSFFMMRDNPESGDAWLLTGKEIRLSGAARPPYPELVELLCAGRHARTLPVRLEWRREDGAWVLRLPGWQRAHWVRISGASPT